MPASFTLRVITVVLGTSLASASPARSQGADSIETQPSVLSEIVVTSTIVETARREVPTPLTVITAQDLRDRGVTDLVQLFRGAFPGMILSEGDRTADFSGMNLYVRGALGYYAGGGLKVYLDGAPLADEKFLSSIDPNSVERIEITRGPQASTLYGSQALAGVMQIFTKKGRIADMRPRLDATFSMGTLESEGANGLAPVHAHSLSLTGGGPDGSYNLGFSYRYTGAWTPETFSRQFNLTGGTRRVYGPVVGTLSGRVVSFTSAYGSDPYTQSAIANGLIRYTATNAATTNMQGRRPSQTVSLRLEYNPAVWWQNAVRLGQDQLKTDVITKYPRYVTPADSLRGVREDDITMTEVGYNGTVGGHFFPALRATLTVGGDMTQVRGSSYQTQSALQVEGPLRQTSVLSLQRRDDENAGVFGQGHLAMFERIFLTAGLRVEHNSNFDSDRQYAYSPRAGLSVVQDVGQLSVKLRSAYGSALRPPTVGEMTPYFFPPSVEYVAPNGLRPQRQTGVDGGVELYIGDRASLDVTYYNQMVRDMISVFTISPAGARVTQYQYQNIGKVRNRGWELQGAYRLGRFNLASQYSVIDSRVVEPTDPTSGSVRPGQRISYVAPYTAAVAVTYAHARSRLNIEMTTTGRAWGSDDVVSFLNSNTRLPDKFVSTAGGRYPHVTRVNTRVLHRISDLVDAFLNIDNLANASTSMSSWGRKIVRGRNAMFGIRLH